MRTIHLEKEDVAAWRTALRDSRDETIIVYRGGYRILLGQGRVLSSSGHSEFDATPIAVDDVREIKRAPAMNAYGKRLRRLEVPVLRVAYIEKQ